MLADHGSSLRHGLDNHGCLDTSERLSTMSSDHCDNVAVS